MINEIETLNNVDIKPQVKLSIPLLATYLARGLKRSEIARICNVSRSAVTDYCNRHYTQLAPLIDKTNTLMANKSKYIANLAQDRIIEHLPKTTEKSLIALNAISGTHIDKSQLLQGESTDILSVKVSKDTIKGLDQQLQVLEAKLLSTNT